MIEKIGRTLEELYDTYVKDFAKFMQLTDGVIYSEDGNGQLKMIMIEDADDLSEHFDCAIIALEEDNNKLQIIIED